MMAAEADAADAVDAVAAEALRTIHGSAGESAVHLLPSKDPNRQ